MENKVAELQWKLKKQERVVEHDKQVTFALKQDKAYFDQHKTATQSMVDGILEFTTQMVSRHNYLDCY